MSTPTTIPAVLRARVEAYAMRLTPAAHWSLSIWRRYTASWVLVFGDGS